MFYLGYAVIQLPKLSNGYHVLSVDVEAYLNDFHGANPPGAPFRLVAPDSSDYVASWINSIYFTIASSDVVTTSTPSVTATPTVTVSPTIPEFPSTILMIAFLITATSLGTAVIKRKRCKRSYESKVFSRLHCNGCLSIVNLDKLFFFRNSLFFRESIKAVNSILT